MTGLWLASYIGLWLFVVAEGVVIFVLIRELGIRIVKSAQGVSRDGPAVGSVVTTLDFSDASGQSLRVPSEGYSVLVFGSKSCQPCLDLVPDVDRFARRHRDVATFLVVDEPDQSLPHVAEILGAAVPVISHPAAWEQYRIRVTPFTVIVTPEGIVASKGVANSLRAIEQIWRHGLTPYGATGQDGTPRSARQKEVIHE